MRRLVKWAAIVVAAIIVLVGVLAGSAHLLAERKRGRVVHVDVRPIAYVSDAASLERGRYLFTSRGCGDCHGPNGAGRVLIDAPDGFFVRAPNITGATGGAVARYGEADWVRAIRHCVKPDGRAMLIMPCEDFNRLTNVDLEALVAYLRRLPPTAGEGAVVKLPLPLKAVYALGMFKDGAEKIDHSRPPEQPVAEAVTVEHGRYVANICLGCHGMSLAGGRIPGGPPDWPVASNLTPGEGSVLPRYDSAEKLRAMFRSGNRPDGSAVAVMPFESLRQINDTDVAALHLYLSSLPPRALGAR